MASRTPDTSTLLQRLEIVPLEDEAFAVAGDVGLLFHLNPTARAILELLQAGESPDEIAQAFTEAQSIAASGIKRDIAALIADIGAKYAAARDDDTKPRPVAPALREPIARAVYRIFDRLIAVNYPDQDVAAASHPLLASMREPDDAPHDLELTLKQTGDDWEVTCGKATVAVHRTAQAAFTGMQRVMLCHDVADPGLFSTVLHAGSVVGKNGAWLIGGHSGSGKSTLITRLDAHGLKILGDDLIPLDLANELAFPLPLALSVKNTAWPIVAAYRPEILQLAPHDTAIGKRVRYLAPLNPPSDADRRGLPIAGLLLPRRSLGASAAIAPISVKHAMVALCDKFGRFPIDPPDLRALIAILSRVPRYELIYDEADDILPELTELL